METYFVDSSTGNWPDITREAAGAVLKNMANTTNTQDTGGHLGTLVRLACHCQVLLIILRGDFKTQ